jgi:hypothetical protein
LPGKFLLGEGKPENQNHAIIFTRGDALQTIDMNQVGLILIIWLQIACSSLPTPFKRQSGIVLLYLSFVGKLYGGSIQDEKPSGRV